MNTTTAGHCNVNYRSVNGSVKLSVTFHSNHGISFLSETGSSTAAIFDAFRTTRRPNQKYYTPMGGRKWTWYLFRNWRENETTWQLKPKRTAAASRGFLAAARLSCSYNDCSVNDCVHPCMIVYWNAVCVRAAVDRRQFFHRGRYILVEHLSSWCHQWRHWSTATTWLRQLPDSGHLWSDW